MPMDHMSVHVRISMHRLALGQHRAAAPKSPDSQGRAVEETEMAAYTCCRYGSEERTTLHGAVELSTARAAAGGSCLEVSLAESGMACKHRDMYTLQCSCGRVAQQPGHPLQRSGCLEAPDTSQCGSGSAVHGCRRRRRSVLSPSTPQTCAP